MSKSRDDTAQKIKSLDFWDSEPELIDIEDGRTNANYLAKVGDETFFVRYGVDLPVHHIYRENEKAAALVASKAGVAPETYFADDGYMVCQFINGQGLTLENCHADQHLARVASTLRELHRLPTENITNRFDLKLILTGYLAQIRSKLTLEQQGLVERIIKELPFVDQPCLVHGDLIPNNFIDDGQKLWLIDWEYAGLGCSAMDLAMISANFELDDQQTAHLVQRHGLCDLAKVKAYLPALIAREALWTLVQIEEVGPTGDLPEYLTICLQRLEQLI